MKQCSKCLEIKPLTQFYKKIRYPDGYDYVCKQCQRPGEAERNKRPKSNQPRNVSREMDKLQRARTSLALGTITQAKFDSILEAYRESKRVSQNQHQRQRYQSDMTFRAIKNVRSRLKRFLANKDRYSKSLGCSQAELRSHIEHQFKEGMGWDNYGDWELDHIVPLALAHKQGEDAFQKACHFSNLQPLWKQDHIEKTRADMKLINAP